MTANEPLSHDERAALTHQVLRVLQHWKLGHDVQLALLGMPEGTRPRALKRFQGGEPLPSDSKVMARVHCLLEIDQALLPMFPHSQALADLWVTTPSPRFDDRSPLEVMVNGGFTAMQGVLDHLCGCDESW